MTPYYTPQRQPVPRRFEQEMGRENTGSVAEFLTP